MSGNHEMSQGINRRKTIRVAQTNNQPQQRKRGYNSNYQETPSKRKKTSFEADPLTSLALCPEDSLASGSLSGTMYCSAFIASPAHATTPFLRLSSQPLRRNTLVYLNNTSPGFPTSPRGGGDRKGGKKGEKKKGADATHHPYGVLQSEEKIEKLTTLRRDLAQPISAR